MAETPRAARPSVIRSVDFEVTRAEQDATGDGLTLEGYAAVFDSPTEIDSWEGVFTEQIRKGAFKKTIQLNTPVLQFDHGRHPLVGSIPIGAIEQLTEDDQGLYVRARLSDNWLIQPVRDAIRERSITGMSFRFEVMRDEWRDKNGVVLTPVELEKLLWKPGDRGPLQRTLIEVRLRELGPVVFPAYDGTSVDVRAREIAERIATDPHAARHSLAAGAHLDGTPDDRELRRQVAAALLFPGATPAERTPTRDTGGAQPLDAERSAQLRSNIRARVDQMREQIRRTTYVGKVAQRQAEGLEGFPAVPARSAPARPLSEDEQLRADGLEYAARDLRREAAEAEHRTRRRIADAETSTRERVHAHYRDLYGPDEADRLMRS